MATKDYNTNTAVPGLKGLQLYEGDTDYEKKKLYKESGITWQDLMQNDPETAYKWASEQLSRNPFRLPNKPVTDDEVANYLNNVTTPSPDMSSIRTMQDLLNESVRVSDEAVVNKLANAQQIADETGYGNSKYDTENEVSLDEMQYLKDIRAAEQSNFAKVGVSGLKAATLAGTTFLDGTVGFIYGVGSAIANGDINKVNANAVSDALQGINNWMEEVAPMYTSEYYDSKPWYQKLNTVELWSDSVLKNMGFTVGALWSGSTATKLLRGIPKVAQSMKAQEILGSMYSAVSEGRIEANQTYHDLLDSTTGQINSAFERYLESIKDDEDYEQKATIALEQREQLLQEAEHNAASAGIQTALANTVLLSLTNYSTWGRMFSKDFNANKQLMFDGLRYNVDKQSFKGVLGNVGKDMFVEGNEEMLQQVASTWSKLSNSIEDPDYYNKAFMDVETKNDTYESLDALGTAFLNTYGNPDEWEQFFAGAATSLIGFGNIGRGNNSNNESVFKGSPVSWQGGILGKYLAMKRDNAEMEQQASALNSAIDKIQSQGNYFTRQAQLLNDMEGYIQNDDRFSYENAQDGLDFNTFSVFQRTGRLDDLKTIIGKDFENMSDSDLEELAKDFNKRTNDGSLVTDTPKGKENFRQELIANQEKMFDRLDKFEKSFSAIKSILPQLDDSQATELAWYHWKQDIFNDRFNDVYDRNKDNIDNLATTVDALINRNEHQFREAISPNIKKQTQVLKALQPFLSSLKDANHISKVFAKGKLTTEGLEYMLNHRSIRDNSGMDAVTYKKTIDAINDINKMAVSVESFNSRLEKYLKHPEELEQERQKEEQKNQEKTEVTNKVNAEADIIRKPLNTLVQMDLEGRFSIDDALKTAGANSESAKHLAKAKALRAAYLKKLDEAKQKLQNPVQFNAYKNALKNTLRTATKPEDLNNVTIEQSSSLDDSLEEVMRQADNVDTSALEGALDALNAEALEASLPNNTDVDNIDTSSLEEAASGRDGQPQIPAVNWERGLEEEETPTIPNTSVSEEDTFDEIFTRAARKAVYNLIWVNDGIIPLEKLAKMLSENNSLFTGMSLPGVIDAIKNDYEKAAQMMSTIKDRYTGILQKVHADSKPFENKENFMSLLVSLSDFVNKSVREGQNNPSVIISNLSGNNYYALLNNSKDAKDNSLSVYVNYLVHSNDNETPSVETEKPIEEVISEQRVKLDEQPVNNRQESVVTEDEKPSNTQKENDKNTYWRPNVTELPFGDLFNEDKRNYTLLWQRIDDLINKGKDAVKAGIARVFGNNEALAIRSRAIGKYLDEHGAYKRANNGEIKVGDDVYFKIDSSLNRDANDFVILMVNDKNEVIGDLPALGDNGVNNAIHLKSFIEEIKRQYEEAGSPETWNVPKTYKTKVTELMRGKAPYNNERNSLKDVFGDLLETASFHVHPVSKLPSISMDIIGKPMSFTFITPYLNEDTRNKNLGKHISILLKKAFRAKNNDDRMQYIRQINSLIVDDVVVYSEPDGSMTAALITQDGTRHNIFKNLTIDNNNINDALDFVWEKLYGSQVIIRDDFKTDFADDLFINLPKDMKLVGSWFTVAPITENGDMIQPSSVKDAKASYLPTTPNRRIGNATITIHGDSYNVDLETWGVTNQKGKALSPSMDENDPVRQALAKAVVVKNGWDLNKPQQTMWGMYRPSNDAIVTQEQSPIQKAAELLSQGKTPTISDLFSDNTSSALGRKLNEERKTTDRGITLVRTQYDNGYELKVEFGDNYVRQAYTSDGRIMGEPKFALDVKNPLTDKYLHTTPSGMFYINQDEILDAFNATVAQNTTVVQPPRISAQTDRFDSYALFKFEHPELSKCSMTMFQKYQNLPKEEAVKKIKRDLDNRNKNIMLREETSSKDKGVTNAEKEWFTQAFPQLSTADRVRIVENLQHKGVKAWGMFKNGVITLANKAASGTLYHEAFHAVTHCLLTTDEKFDMFSEAQKKYGSHLNKRELEENLAEDFRRYMQFSEMPFVGKLVKLFRNLKHWIKTLAGNESAIDKLMYEIASGKLKDRSILNYTDYELFSAKEMEEIQKEIEEIRTKAIADGRIKLKPDGTFDYALAPNGNRSNLNERQWLHVRTTRFKKWFGDWEKVAIQEQAKINFKKAISEFEATDNIGTYSNEEDDIRFRYIDFSSINGVQEHLDRTINNMQGRTKQAMINEWAKIADVWRAAGINVKAVFQKIGRNPGRMVVKKIEMFNTRNYITPSRYSYSTLNDEERDIIASKNMTPQEYDSLPDENKNLIWKCAKLGY